jgi:hypothetical protein
MNKEMRKARLIIDELTPMVNEANTLDECIRVNNIVFDKCISEYKNKEGKVLRAFHKLPSPYKEDVNKLFTILDTKISMWESMDIKPKTS